MTRPDEPGLAPARRGRGDRGAAASPAQPSGADYDDAEVVRGQAVAVLGALGRLQLKLDVLAREQRDSLERLTAQVAALDARLSAALGQAPRPAPTAPTAPAAAPAPAAPPVPPAPAAAPAAPPASPVPAAPPVPPAPPVAARPDPLTGPLPTAPQA